MHRGILTPLGNPPTKNLLSRLIRFGLIGQIILIVLLFGSGTFDFWQGWAFAAVNLVITIVFCTHLYRHDRELLARRLIRKEKVGAQKVIMFILRNLSIIAYILCGLDHRFGWSRTYLVSVPAWLTILALVAYAGCYLFFIPVLDANRFASSIVQVEASQTVADQGPYRFVRHPLYAVSLVVWFWVPLALGSFVMLPTVILFTPLIVWRLLNEEKILKHDLPGYNEYCQHTPYRLIPHVW